MGHHEESNEPLDLITIRFTASKPRRAFAISCTSFCIVFLAVMIAVMSGGLIAMSTEVPFYNRSEANQKRQDAVNAAETQADGLQVSDVQTERANTEIELYILYIVDEGENIITKDYIDHIASIESEIRRNSDYAPLAYWMDGYEEGVTIPQNTSDSGFCTLAKAYAFAPDGYDGTQVSFQNGSAVEVNLEPTNRMCLRQVSLVNFNDYGYFDYENNTGLGWYIEATESAPVQNLGDEAHIETFRSFWSTFEGAVYDLGPYVYPGEDVEFLVPVGNMLYEVTSSDFGGASASTTARGARSVFKFGGPRVNDDGGLYDINDLDDEISQNNEFGEFLYYEFHDFLSGKNGDAGVDVYWDDSLGLMAAWHTGILLVTSMLWLLGSILFVWCYLVMSTSSFLLATLGMGQIFMCFGPAILLYRVLFGFEYFGTLQFLAIFIIMGVGVDDMFVVLDSWAQRCDEQDIWLRLSKTMRHASKAMFTTSATTFVSFVANMSSAFPAIKTFGAFSAMLILVNFCAVCTFFPTCVVMWEVYHRNNKCCGCIRKKAEKPSSDIELVRSNPVDVVDDLESPSATAVGDGPSDELRATERFFRDRWSRVVVQYRMYVFIGFAAIVAIFIWGASQLVPDPNVPELLPDGDNYVVYGDKLKDHYNRAENPQQIGVQLQHGISRDDPIDRSGTDETIADDIGDANYCVDPYIFNQFGPTSQMAMVDMCLSAYGEDMIYGELKNGETYTAEDREVYGKTPDTTEFGLTFDDVMTCPWVSFRKWCLDPYRSFNHTHDLCDPAQAGTGMSGDCYISYPIISDDPSLLLNLLAAWYTDPQRDTTTGETNEERFVDFIYIDDCDDPDEQDNVCQAGIEDQYEGLGSLRFVRSELRLDAIFAMEYSKGIKLYDKWEGWWNEFTSTWQTKAEYSSTDYADSGETLNEDGRYSYPGMLDGCGFQGTAAWSYYFLNETLIGETFMGIFLALVLAWIILTLACGNWIISSLSVFTILLIVTGVVAFAVAVGWKLGVLEAINFVMVIGLSIDYCVHLSEAFTISSASTRAEKVQDMLTTMGVSVVSGGISSMGASIWMLGATITFFPKFASFILVTIALSLLFSLTFFPALLSVCGPLGEQGSMDWFYDFFRRGYTKLKEAVSARA